jgi:hypothetical protein
MKGDRVEIVVDTGDGAKTYEVNATRAGASRSAPRAAWWR